MYMDTRMQTSTNVKRNKHFILNQKKLERAKKILGASTETETVELALERVITEAERDKTARAAHDRFVRSMVDGGLQLEDVFGRLND